MSTPAQTIATLRKRLERWELGHLRELAASLCGEIEAAHARIDALECALDRAESAADAWRDDTLRLIDELEAAGRDVGVNQAGQLVPCADAQQPAFALGDAWRYCTRLTDPDAAKALAQAAVTASATIHFAFTKANPEDFATAPDWLAVQRELLHALYAAGHPAGRARQ
ncbi:hypothetical protein [Comamonas granuli]|uniref:hypothetical protein n=1 Tax=Comamonas granuli TaxID=290309 RepID=UPI0005A73342|nr:hypothetical protein [Comamonas granuli]